MKTTALVVLLAAGTLFLAPLSQAHADSDDLGAAALGFAFGAAISGAPTVIYQAPAPRVYVPARRYYHYHRWYDSRGYGDHPRWHRHEHQDRRWHHRHHRDHDRRWRHHHRFDDDD